MRRPLLVSLIAGYFLAGGIYLSSLAVMFLVMPRSLSTLQAAPFVHTVRSISPYLTLFIGFAWCWVGWGLIRLKPWARFTGSLFLGVGVAREASMLFLRPVYLGWRTPIAILEIVLRAAAVVYLASFGVIDIFEGHRQNKSRVL
jgi:hypothetical protein